jgi:hypothetical protein
MFKERMVNFSAFFLKNNEKLRKNGRKLYKTFTNFYSKNVKFSI